MEKHKIKNLNIKLVVAAFIIVGTALALFAYQNKYGDYSQQTEMSSIYRVSDKEKPILIIEPENLINDLGTMKASEDRITVFTLKNTGLKPLVISRLRTSCMCTFGQIVYESKESPMVGMEMHNSPLSKDFRVELKPGGTAIAKILYRPALMPVQGPVERSFLFETNDPKNKSVELVIKAFVEL